MTWFDLCISIIVFGLFYCIFCRLWYTVFTVFMFSVLINWVYFVLSFVLLCSILFYRCILMFKVPFCFVVHFIVLFYLFHVCFIVLVSFYVSILVFHFTASFVLLLYQFVFLIYSKISILHMLLLLNTRTWQYIHKNAER